MDHLDDVPLEALQRELASIDGNEPTQRLLAAIAYKRGVSQTELAEWFDVGRRTIYNWLDRFDGADIASAIEDDARPGRPRLLDDEQQAELVATLRGRPGDAGFDATLWTPKLVRRWLQDRFDVDYSVPSCRRCMREAGLRYRTASELRDLATDDAADSPLDRDDVASLDSAGWVYVPE